MSILVDKNTRLLVQGITGKSGATHAKSCMEYGTNVVAGVTPTRGGEVFENKVPVFDTVMEARAETGCNATMIFVPPAGAADSILEAVDAGIELVICITEGIPVIDMMRVKAAMAKSSSRLIGPNCPGIITPGECKIGIMPGYIHKPGKVGVVSRSGTLTYEAVWQLSSRGHGQSTCVGIGGDPINGTSHLDVVKMFNDDPDTEAFIMIGEIGGTAEEEAAEWIAKNCKSPSPPSSQEPQRLPVAAWVTLAPSSAAVKVPHKARSRPSKPPASKSPLRLQIWLTLSCAAWRAKLAAQHSFWKAETVKTPLSTKRRGLIPTLAT